MASQVDFAVLGVSIGTDNRKLLRTLVFSLPVNTAYFFSEAK
jgi:hypothetical protein